jgi:hypothetical protein
MQLDGMEEEAKTRRRVVKELHDSPREVPAIGPRSSERYLLVLTRGGCETNTLRYTFKSI